MALARIKKGDMVQVISGREKGKTGKVLEFLTKREKVLVEHLNKIKRHTKPKKQGEPGGIVEKEAALPLSVVMPLCPKCNKGVRVVTKIVQEKKETLKVRVCAHCEEPLQTMKKK